MRSSLKLMTAIIALSTAVPPAFANGVSTAPTLVALNKAVSALPLPLDTDARDLTNKKPTFDAKKLDFNTPFVVLERYTSVCSDLEWKGTAYVQMLWRMPDDIVLWNGRLEDPMGPQYQIQEKLLNSLDSDYTTYGAELCRAVYAEYGPNGKLGKHLAKFVNHYSPDIKYGQQIVFRGRDLCANVDGFYKTEDRDEKRSMVSSCKRATEFANFWGD